MAKKTKPAKKKKGIGSLLVKVFIGLIIIGAIGSAFGSKDKKTDKTGTSQTEVTQKETAKPETSQPETTAPETSQPETTAPETEKTVLFESDEVVNEFLVRYNSTSSSPFTDIEKGNIRIKCFAYTYDRYVELLNGNTGNFYVKIHASFEHQDVADLRDAFKDVVTTLDPSITADEAFASFDKSMADATYRSEVPLGNTTCTVYPTVDSSIGRIEISIPVEKMYQ